MTAPLTDTGTGPGDPGGSPADDAPATSVHAVDLPLMEPSGDGTGPGPSLPLGALAGVTVTVSVELGRVRLPIGRLLSLQPGAVLELDRQPGEPVDIHVNDRLVARGEVVLVDGDFGVRVTEILTG